MAPVLLLFFLFPTLLVLTVAVLGIRSSGHDASLKKKGLKVPPGNMSWPLLGETIAFRKLHPCTSLGHYMEEHVHKYGKIYKSHLFGHPAIVSADAELNRLVLMSNDGRLFEPSFPKSVADILGKTSMLVLTGEMHRYMKSLSVNFMGIARLRNNFLGDSPGEVHYAQPPYLEGPGSIPCKRGGLQDYIQFDGEEYTEHES